jgi:hypothetical protein
MNLNTVEIKAFAPARDDELSRAFYQAAGFTMAYADEDVAHFRAGECSSLLQNDPGRQLPTELLMHLLVDNVDDWHARLTELGIAGSFGVTMGAISGATRRATPARAPWIR